MDCPEHSGVSIDCPQIRIVGQERSKSSPKKGSSNSEENGAEDDVSSADVEHLQFDLRMLILKQESMYLKNIQTVRYRGKNHANFGSKS